MMTRVSMVALLVASLGAAPPIIARCDAGEPAPQVADVVAKVQASVVRIVVVHLPAATPEAGSDKDASAEVLPATHGGSGFVIDPSGLIATNRHVVELAASIFVYTSNGARFRAELVGMTVKADIALIRIHTGTKLPAVGFADSDKVRVGDAAVAIGSPYGLNNTVTAGVVSAVDRDIFDSPFDDYIQTDAAINHGNSGGPLFNLVGQVIGMNTALYGPTAGSSGLGFAIPANDLRFVLDRLAENGKVRAGMLPIRAQQVTAMIAQAIGAPSLNGALVDAVDSGSDQTLAENVKPGDLILAFDGQPVLDPRDLARKLVRTAIGSSATLEILHNGARRTVQVTVQGWPEANLPHPGPAAQRHLGLEFAPAAPGTPGVTVTLIDPTGTAADSGIEKGDLILRVQQVAASDPAQVTRVLDSVPSAEHPYAVALVKRGDVLTWVAIAVP
ncbi:MAG: serine protease Do [Mycobacterium sp.]|nr:serine protease Do [Mycobacterium sp.]